MKRVLLLSFISLNTVVTAQQTQPKDTIATQNLDNVLVEAVRVKPDAPIAHTNVSQEELGKRNLGQDLPLLLNFLPSVVTTSDAGAGVGYTDIRIRGISAQSTNVTLNGIPYNDAESLRTYWVNLPDFSSSVKSLQMQRGIGTSTQGSGAFGASINVATDLGTEAPSVEISNSYGSFNTRKHTVKLSTGQLKGVDDSQSLIVSGRLSQINSEGYIDRASSDLKSYFLQGVYKDNRRLIKTLAFGGHEVTYQAWYGIDPEALKTNRTFNPAGIYTDNDGLTQFYDNQVDNYKQDHYQLHWNETLNSNWSTNLGLNYTYGRGYYEEYDEGVPFGNYNLSPISVNSEDIAFTNSITRKWLDNDYYVANANATYKEKSVNLIFGGFYSLYKGDHFGELIWAQYPSNSNIRDRYYNDNGRKEEMSYFAKGTVKLNSKWTIYGDLQHRLIEYSATFFNSSSDIKKNYSFFNPKAGITYFMNKKNSLYTSYARASREPNRTDLENNPNIKPERLNDFEMGWRHNNTKLKFATNLYYMAYNEQLTLTGALDAVGNPIRSNSGKSYRLGVELEAEIKLSNYLSNQTNLTLSKNKAKETISSIDGGFVNLGNTNLTYSPEIVAANTLTIMPIENLQLHVLSKFVGEQYLGNTNSPISKLKSYFVNDLNVNYTLPLKKFIKSLTVSALVNNILNKKYVSNGYYYSFDDTWSEIGTTTTIEGVGYYPQATTNVLVGATLRF